MKLKGVEFASKLRSITTDLDKVERNRKALIFASIIGGFGALKFKGGTGILIGAGCALLTEIISQNETGNKFEEAQKVIKSYNAMLTSLHSEIHDRKCKLKKICDDLASVQTLLGKEWSGVMYLNSFSFIDRSIKVTTVPLGLAGVANIIHDNKYNALAKQSYKSMNEALDSISELNIFSENVNGKEGKDNAKKMIVKATKHVVTTVKKIQFSIANPRNHAKQFQILIRSRFKHLLERLSIFHNATSNEQQELCNLMFVGYSSDEWKRCITEFNINACDIVKDVANITTYLLEAVSGNESKQQNGELTITLIGHGAVKPEDQLPCQLYFMNPFINSIKLYSPWGCTVDSYVVYGIATGSIKPHNRLFSTEGAFYHKLIQDSFNELDSNSSKLIPTATFYPIKVSDTAFDHLMKVQDYLQHDTKGLVISYFSSTIMLPKAPLWHVTNSMAIIGYLLNLKINFQYAACLSYSSGTKDCDVSKIDQYCHAPQEEPPRSMSVTLPKRRRRHPDKWDSFVTEYQRFVNTFGFE